jgi:hypothetical protein
MKKLSTLLAMLFLGASTTLLPIISQVTAYFRPATNQWLLLGEETHLDLKKGEATQKQRHDLVELLQEQRMQGHTPRLIVEEATAPPKDPAALGLTVDSSLWQFYLEHELEIHANPKNFLGIYKDLHIKLAQATEPIEPAQFKATPWQQAYRHTPMHGLTQQCAAKDIPCDNVERRFFENTAHLTVGMLLEANEAVIAMIQKWKQDPAIAQDTYTDAIEEYYNDPFTKALYAHKPIYADFARDELHALEKSTPPMDVFHASLLDPILLHTICEAKDNSLLFSLCGGYHHAGIEDALSALGFEKQKTYGQNDWRNEEGTHWILPVLDLTMVFDDLPAYQTPSSWFNWLAPLHAGNLLGMVSWPLLLPLLA